jgi:hypothetical protein
MDSVEQAWRKAAKAWNAVAEYIDNYEADRYSTGRPDLVAIESLKADAKALECLAQAEAAKSPEARVRP